MSMTPRDTTLEALTSRVAALEQALAAAASGVFSSAVATVPAVQATGTHGAHGVDTSSDSDVGLYTQSGTGIGLHAVGGGASPSPTMPLSAGAIVAEGGPSYGLYATSTGGTGVAGTGAIGISGHGGDYGVFGSGATGVYGESGYGAGVSGECPYGTGVLAQSLYGIGLHAVGGGVSPTTPNPAFSQVAIFAEGGPSGGLFASSTSGTGVSGSTVSDIGVYGSSLSGIGVYGDSNSNIGVNGYSISGTGVSGSTVSGTGVYGNSPNGYAGYFVGSVYVSGPLQKPGGGFQIDHPLDAAHKYLSHSFVESPEMKNLYDGVVTLDANGQAEVRLPDWFETLNTEVRYQLTCLGSYAPVYIAEQLQHNRFTIAGGRAGMEVSWQVTGIRQDRWAAAHRLPVEQDKPAIEQGYYLHPDLYGEPEEKSIHHVRYPDLQRPGLQHK